ncbi:AMP-binding protein [Spongiivirga sp. MCCC 1A20706]|uniref:AMP-binding protein n=1 Tax=Spongiivirga sp. MCCC 1A20706 TaxID=3160963 RepID=UPI0039774E31
MNFLNHLFNSFKENESVEAFCINDVFYTYGDLMRTINVIRALLREKSLKDECHFGLITNNDLETYATIFALWFEGKAYIPINPNHPKKRNQEILADIDIRNIFNSSNEQLSYQDGYNEISTRGFSSMSNQHLFGAITFDEKAIAYIIYTSGSTGKPKGIPITFGNLNALFSAINSDAIFKLNKKDRCLQMYDLTFDASLTAFLPGLFVGACIYTVPPNSMKYFKILKLIAQYELTVLKMVPSIIYYLKPYFKKIHAPSVRYCIFGGGKLFEDIVLDWMKSIPNAKILNHYGPTETTVCSSYYAYDQSSVKKFQGILSIGKPWPHLDYLIVDENGQELGINEHGELCIAGEQLTKGYLNNPKKNSSSFFDKNVNGVVKRYYKSGDICYQSDDGNYMYVGRIDFQVKIRGYRVELSEIEYHAKAISNSPDILVIDILNALNNAELALVTTNDKLDFNPVIDYLKTKVPDYMVPTKAFKISDFPLNLNGKIDREKVRESYYNQNKQ